MHLNTATHCNYIHILRVRLSLLKHTKYYISVEFQTVSACPHHHESPVFDATRVHFYHTDYFHSAYEGFYI